MQLQQMRWVRIATLLLLVGGIVLLCFSLFENEEITPPPAVDIKVLDKAEAEAARLQAEADRLAWEARLAELKAERQQKILLFSGIALSALLGFLFIFTVKQKQDAEARSADPKHP